MGAIIPARSAAILAVLLAPVPIAAQAQAVAECRDGIDPAGAQVAGYVDECRFTVAGARIDVLCVTLVADGAAESPCADAGGAFQARFAVLFDEDAPVPVGQPPLVVRTCESVVQATVLGFGLEELVVTTVC